MNAIPCVPPTKEGPAVLDLREHYSPTSDGIRFHKRPETFLGAGGEKGGGKTWGCIYEGLRLSLTIPGNRGCIFRQKKKTLLDTTMSTFWKIVPDDLIADHNRSEGTITFINGSVILYRGLSGSALMSKHAIQQYIEDLKSMELGWFYVNEGSQTIVDFWHTLKTTLRWIPPGWEGPMFYRGMADSNPEPGWFYETFLRRLPENHAFVHFKQKNNTGLSESYASMFADMPQSWKDRYLKGLWEFGQEGEGWVFPLDIIMLCQDADRQVDRDIPAEYGLDPAREGKDEAVLFRNEGGTKFTMWVWPKCTTTQLRDSVAAIVRERPGVVKIEWQGMGADVYDILKEKFEDEDNPVEGASVAKVNIQETPKNKKKFVDKKTEIMWHCREWMADHIPDIPDDEQLRTEMSNLQFDFDKYQRIEVEKKAKYKARMGVSPGRMEALAYAVYPARKGIRFH